MNPETVLLVQQPSLDEDRPAYDSGRYDGDDSVIVCRGCDVRFVETFETDACPGCGTEGY